jgi:hypothetical protein
MVYTIVLTRLYIHSNSRARNRISMLLVWPSHQKKRRVTVIWCWFSRRFRLCSRESESYGKSLKMTCLMTCYTWWFVCRVRPLWPSQEQCFTSSKTFSLCSRREKWQNGLWNEHVQWLASHWKWVSLLFLAKSPNDLDHWVMTRWPGNSGIPGNPENPYLACTV